MASAFCIAGKEVATTCTSRIAMNMPTHMMAKPSQVRITGGATEVSGVSKGAVSMQRRVLGVDANGQHGGIRQRENQRERVEPQAQRKHRDLADHNNVVGMRDPPVGSPGHQ